MNKKIAFFTILLFLCPLTLLAQTGVYGAFKSVARARC